MKDSAENHPTQKELDIHAEIKQLYGLSHISRPSCNSIQIAAVREFLDPRNCFECKYEEDFGNLRSNLDDLQKTRIQSEYIVAINYILKSVLGQITHLTPFYRQRILRAFLIESVEGVIDDRHIRVSKPLIELIHAFDLTENKGGLANVQRARDLEIEAYLKLFSKQEERILHEEPGLPFYTNEQAALEAEKRILPWNEQIFKSYGLILSE